MILLALFAASAEEPNHLSLGTGAVMVRATKASEQFGAVALDGSLQTLGIGIPKREPLPLTITVELLAPTTVQRFELPVYNDYGSAQGRHVKTLRIEGSAEGPEAGFTDLVTIVLKQGVKEPQVFPVAAPRQVRWLRMTAVDTHQPAKEDFRPHNFTDIAAFGPQVAPPPGKFEGRWRLRRLGLNDEPGVNLIELHQQGTEVVGCERVGGAFRVITGSVEGGLARLVRSVEQRSSPFTAVVTSEGDLSGVDFNGPPRGFWAAPDTSTDWLCPIEIDKDPMQTALAEGLTAVLYGIHFDVDSDVLRADAKPALDRLLKALQGLPKLSVRIVGHTDSDASDAHNQDLSERRAKAVVAWLTAREVAAARLTAAGKGESAPIADNGTSAGKALNRRVEIEPLP